MSFTDLPTLNVILNFTSAIFLALGYIQIKKGNRGRHKKFMLAALSTSILFLCSYLIYHYQVGSIKYPHFDWTRIVYFSILIPHIILSAAMCPFITFMVWHALHGNFNKHKQVAKFIWPIWMFVSISGIIVYFMLYQFR